MVRNIMVLGGSSHPSLNAVICDKLGIPLGNVRHLYVLQYSMSNNC